MTNPTAPAAPLTDDELLAGLDRGIAAGAFVVVDDAYLARLAAEIDAEGTDAGAAGMLDLDAHEVGMLF